MVELKTEDIKESVKDFDSLGLRVGSFAIDQSFSKSIFIENMVCRGAEWCLHGGEAATRGVTFLSSSTILVLSIYALSASTANSSVLLGALLCLITFELNGFLNEA